MGRLDGKVALISGGARGQGAAEAQMFAEEGAKVVFGDILDEEGRRVEQIIRQAGGEATYIHLDVTDEAQWVAAVVKAVEGYGSLEILVNNAGIAPARKSIEETSVEDWDKIQSINTRGVFLGTKHAIPAMRAAGGGSIINICSIASMGQWARQDPAYASSKAAVRVFSRLTAAQHAADHIRSNAVFPGPIDTEMLKEAMASPQGLTERLKRVPMGRMGTIDEITSAVLFLASDDSSYMTGGEMVIDGGATSM